MEMVNGLAAGNYTATIQTFSPFCFAQVVVSVTDGGSSDPCANAGGDSDGDGICNAQDNCDFVANPDQADNDGDGIGNVCDDTPNGDPCANRGGDADGDGVCQFDDCDDTNPNIGAQQAAGTLCNDGNPDTENDVILADGCSCAGTPSGPAKCANRTVINTSHCTDIGVTYGFFLVHRNLERRYTFNDGEFMEFTDGTAMLTGRINNNGDPSIAFDVNINFTGRTTVSPTGPAREHRCLDPDTQGFYYYADLTGTLIGVDQAEGAVITVRDEGGEAFQLGNGANVTNSDLSFGGSGWLTVTVQSEPTTGLFLDIIVGGNSQGGDININLTGDGTECPDGASSREGPNASGLNISANDINVYPNPTQEDLYINLSHFKGESGNIKILNLYGQLIQEVKIDEITENVMRLDMGNFQNGLYHLNIKVGSAQPITKKILVSRLY